MSILQKLAATEQLAENLSDLPDAREDDSDEDGIQAGDDPAEAKSKMLGSLRPDGRKIDETPLDVHPASPPPQPAPGPPPPQQMAPEPPPMPPAPPGAPPMPPGMPPGPPPGPQGQQMAPPLPPPPMLPPAPPPPLGPNPALPPTKVGRYLSAARGRGKLRNFTKKAYYGSMMPGMMPHSFMPPTMNQFGYPQGAYNHAYGMNPMGFPRPGVQGGAFGFHRGGMYGMPGMGPMGGMMGYGMPGGGMMPRHGEDHLRDNYHRNSEMIFNMAGQLNPATGRPYAQAEIDRHMNSLNSDTNRQLQTLRSTRQTYGGMLGSTGQPQFMPGGGFHHMGMPGAYGQPSSSELRDRLTAREDRARESRRSSEEPAPSFEQLQQFQDRVHQLARRTSASTGAGGGTTHPNFTDPLTRQPIQFGDSGLFGLNVGPSGQTMDSGAWKDFNTQWGRYQDAHRRYQASRGNRQRESEAVLGTQGGSDPEATRLRRQLERQEQLESGHQQMQQQVMARQFGIHAPSQPASPATPSAGASPAAPAAANGVWRPIDQPEPKTAAVRITPLTMAQLCDSVGRGLVKSALPLAGVGRSVGDALKRVLLLTAGGAAAGGVVSGLTAPVDYFPEAVGRGIRMGAGAGLGAGIGYGAGLPVGAGLRKLTGAKRMVGGSVPLVTGTVGATAGGGATHRAMGEAPWESGEIPLLERLDAQTRRRSASPGFDGNRITASPPPMFSKLSAARHALTNLRKQPIGRRHMVVTNR